MRFWVALACLAAVLSPVVSQAASRVAKRVIRDDAAGMVECLVNGGFEETTEAGRTASGWDYWQEGYSAEQDTTRSGAAAVRCSSTDPEPEYGAAQTVALNQTDPLPIVAGGWSKAEDVSGSPGSGYSVYVDITYTDGTPLWGQISAFDTGTHDWQRHEVLVVPEKPVRELNVYGLFRGHTGTVYFDDFSVRQLELAEGAQLFDGVPVMSGEPAQAGPPMQLLVRDVAANSDFLAPELTSTSPARDGMVREYACPELDLRIRTEWRTGVPKDGASVRGQVEDLRGEDRAIAVYVVESADFAGGEFGLDMRKSTRIDEAVTYSNSKQIGAGTNGRMSWYPIAPVWDDDRGLCVATSLGEPRVCRLAYDAGSLELYAAFDLGLSPATSKFPSRATFTAVTYPFDPDWGFRAALASYYALFPEYFEKRVEREGIWMPFTDIATVQDPDDFGFMFKEGDNNVAWDEAHEIYTFVYVEPMSHWLPLAPEVRRTYEAAVAEIERRAATEAQSQATLQSGYWRANGSYHLWLLDAPWCDGAMLATNPDPDLCSDRPDLMTQAKHEFATIDRALERASQATTGAWRAYGDGFEEVEGVARNGQRSAGCTNEAGQEHGLTQTVVVRQQDAAPLVARAWSRADGVTGDDSIDYSLYLDLVHTDGTSTWGHVTPFRTGTHDWQQAEVVIGPEKPVQTVTLNLLLRRQHTGQAWFDDVFLGQEGSDENLLKHPGFEVPPTPSEPAELDGTYIDSYEMAATEQNYRREHWAYVDLPLTFSLTTREVCSLGIFHTYEFERELAKRMHARGKLTFANATLMNFAFPAHLLDVMGIETNWAPGGVYTPNSDEVMNFRRALCYRKPYCLLLNTDYNAFKPEWVELYFKRCTFYAIFPSFFSHNAADDPYWQNPALYNRDRPLFLKYIPVIRTLSRVGWEPIPHARVTEGGDGVYVERYGDDLADGLYLTLFNDSRQASTFGLSIEADRLGLTAGAATAEDVLTGASIDLDAAGEILRLAGSLAAEDVRIMRLSAR